MVYQKVNTVELAGVEHNRKDSDFEFEDQTVTVEMISKLQEFENARTLRFQNCEFKKGALKELGKLDGLSFLEFENCKGIKNLNLLNSMPDLYKLSVVNCGLNDDSFQLSKTMEHLNELVVTNNPELTKCDWLSYMPKLYSLSLSYNGITDMAPIADLEELGILEMTDNKLQDASAQMKSLRLTKVNLSNNQIADFNGLSDLTILKRVYLGGNHYVEEEGTSLEFLKKSAAELVVADLSGNDFSPETFGYLADCVNLEELYIDGNQRVGSLEFLQNSATLQIFMASGCGISSLRGLEENKELRKIDLSNNQLETLAYFPQLETEMSVNLFLEGNKLKDISALPKGATYSVLLLYGNELDADAVNILTERKGSQIGMTYVEGMVPNVIAGFNLAYVENVPADKRVAWEDAHRGCEFGVLDKEGNVEEQ